MKKWLIMLVFLSLANVTIADQKIPILIEGVVGDFARQAKIYEINGKFYHFQKDIIIENPHGERLTFDHLRSGRHIKVFGEKTIGEDLTWRTQYNKIVIIK